MTWLDEIEARANAATVGPWAVDWDYREDGADQIDGGSLTIAFMATPAGDHAMDAVFIAAARTDVPRLCATLRKVEALAELLKATLDPEDAWDRAGLAIAAELRRILEDVWQPGE
jgi:hypothetical protein